ncbi:ATP-binding protein [Dyadobacter sandarakinus]|uniref:histidine kinase n=1 Tax=Dyadobacter sandarakinus TaxID=2747268 RepID=A0ABX7I3W7_9BACT|nr:ATP-binding protein [Dyadobacter sandarakinus]QRR00620.1 PAS domain-containing protein [Dyadobacter sandarakinus]
MNNGTSLEFLAGGGEMGDRIRSFDWEATPLGIPEHWPQSLRTCVRIMLSSKQPIWIGWGSQLIKLYNDAYIDIVRGKHPIALGQPASVVWKDIWRDIEPLLTKAMTTDEGTYVESQLLIMERSGFPEETYYTFSYTPVLDEGGRPAGIICYNTADTDRIVNERLLRTMQQLDTLAQKKNEKEIYEQAVWALGSNPRDFPLAIIYKIDKEGTEARMAAASGIIEDHPALPPVINLQNPDTAAETMSKAVLGNRIVESTGNHRWKDLPKGVWDVQPWHYVDIPIKSGNKKYPLAVLTVGLNPYRKFDDAYRNFIQLVADQISLGVNNALAYEEERKRAKMLEELDKAKTLFFTNVSHEFRTPLMLMLGPLEELLNDQDVQSAAHEKLEVTHRNALRLLKLVNTLLDFSRIESGRIRASFVLTDLADYTSNLAANFRSVVEKAGLKLVVHVVDNPSPVYIDRQMWEKIIFNLLSNAFKYTLEGSITITVSSEHGQAVVRVTDTGVGIPAKELPKMFERFHRIQNTAGRTFEGTGIGLSLIKELVQLHEGSITVESTSEKGSTFIVKLPVGKSHIRPQQAFEEDPGFDDIVSAFYIEEASSLLDQHADTQQLPAPVSSEMASAETILIVDDNADMRQHVQSLIGRRYQTRTAGNGVEALKVIAEFQPSLILSDIMMPEMDGIELLRRIKDNPATASIPMILITARAGEESKIEGYEIGADDYLIKPFSANELIARIKAQLRIAGAHRHIQKKLESYLMQMPAGVALVECPGFRYTMANALFRNISGTTQLTMMGARLKEAFKDKKLDLNALYRQVYTTGKPFTCRELAFEPVHTGLAAAIYYDVLIYPIRDADEQVSEIMVHMVDTTAQVEAMKRIEASEKQFRSVLLESPNIFLILRGAEMRISFVNPPLLRSWDKTEQIVGKTLLEVLPELRGQPFPTLLEQVYRTGKLYYGNEEKASILIKGVAQDFYYNYVYQPIFDIENRISGITVMATDITEEVRSRRVIEESEEKFRMLTETLPQLVWMTDKDGTLQFASRQWLEYSGMILYEGNVVARLIHPDEQQHVVDVWQESLRTGNIFRVEVRLKNRHGDYRWHYGQGVPMRNEEGEIRNWIGTYTDIHDQKMFTDDLEKKIQQRTLDLVKANRELESFNYIASHDLQEPLRKIQTFINLIQKSPDDRGATERYFTKIYSSAERMSELIHSVLEYSRLSNTGDEFAEVDLNRVLEDVRTDFELLIQEKNATIEYDQLPVVRANAFRMSQLFSNLISNSLKFTQRDPVISIVWEKVPGESIPAAGGMDAGKAYMHMVFKDNGIGFEPEFSEKIFTLFQRLHGKHEYSGTGIGLSIVKKIIEQHEGFIAAESEPGSGATFHIWLPA